MRLGVAVRRVGRGAARAGRGCLRRDAVGARDQGGAVVRRERGTARAGVLRGGLGGGLRLPGKGRRACALRALGVLRLQQPHGVAAELGDEGAGQPGVAGAAVGDGVVGARELQDAVQEGRAAGSLRRQARTRSAMPSGTPERSGSSSAMRNIRACAPSSAEPKGRVPVAA